MAPKFHFQPTLFILLLINPSSIFLMLGSASLSQRRSEREYCEWLSWNIANYHRKKRTTTSAISLKAESGYNYSHAAVGLRIVATTSSSTGRAGLTMEEVVDAQLKNAELNKVRITVGRVISTPSWRQSVASLPTTQNESFWTSNPVFTGMEKLSIPRNLPFVTLLGDSSDPPTITGNDTASSMSGRDGKPLKTFQSATVVIDANYFVAINIKFENTAPHQIGSVGGQAVALRISGTKAAFYNCSFYGTQDTLYDHKGLHYFNNCYIQGSVDFIFGYGTSLYENCYLNSVTKKVALTAQKRSNATIMSSGFSFKDCIVTGSGKVFLGRAWGDYSRVVFSFTFLDKLVLPQGWSDWGKHTRDSSMYYGEYMRSGPGANLTGRVSWARTLTEEEAKPFIGTYYVDGDTWIISP